MRWRSPILKSAGVTKLQADGNGPPWRGRQRGGRPSCLCAYALPGEVIEAELSGSHASLRQILTRKPPAHRSLLSAFRSMRWLPDPALAGRSLSPMEARSAETALRNQGVEAEVEPLIDAQGEGRRRATFHVATSAGWRDRRLQCAPQPCDSIPWITVPFSFRR